MNMYSMLNEDKITRVWNKRAEAEVRSLYFGDLASGSLHEAEASHCGGLVLPVFGRRGFPVGDDARLGSPDNGNHCRSTDWILDRREP